LRSISLKPDGLDESYEVRLFFFNRGVWTGRFEEPNATIVSRPGGDCARICAGNIDSVCEVQIRSLLI
jgi:hypothetical protein